MLPPSSHGLPSKLRSPSFSPAIATALFLVAFCNQALWRKLFEIKGGIDIETIGFYTPFFIVLSLLLFIFFTLLRFKLLFKPILVLFFIAASIGDYFMLTYGVVIDKVMMQNALETHSQEAFELMTSAMLTHTTLFGILPALIILKLPLSYTTLPKQLVKNIKQILIGLAIMGTIAYFFYGDYTSIYRNNREVRYLISPINLIDSLVSNLKNKFRENHPLVAIGTDASLITKPTPSARKNLTILVVGETARAANFALDGYPRPTNPMLSQENIFNFSQVYSCGTATAVSVPCMFSGVGQQNFDGSKAKYTENLVDVLTHAGIKVLWRNNNDSCKGVCERVSYEDMSHLPETKLCNDTVCYDEVLLYKLQDYLDKSPENSVIVLHQQGSHGPGYHLRHPPEFNIFKPECNKAMLNDCSQQELINAYDNTIAYTDYFLSQVIKLLKTNSEKYNTAMLYVSDHGESLGENNVYLHGLPYFIAPEEQRHVPMVTWFSDNFLLDHKIDGNCLKQQHDIHYSHDNLFHSVLGLMEVSTTVYDQKLDIFSNCQLKS